MFSHDVNFKIIQSVSVIKIIKVVPLLLRESQVKHNSITTDGHHSDVAVEASGQFCALSTVIGF